MARTISSATVGPINLQSTDNPLTITTTGSVGSNGSGVDAIDGSATTAWTISNVGTVTAAGGYGIRLSGAGTISNSGSISGVDGVVVGGGGSVIGMISACEQVIAKLPADVKVIPGHGAVSNLDDVRAYTKMLKETLDVVQKGVRQGKTLDQLKQEKVLDPWQKWTSNAVTTDVFLETLYNDVTGKKDERLIKHN